MTTPTPKEHCQQWYYVTVGIEEKQSHRPHGRPGTTFFSMPNVSCYDWAEKGETLTSTEALIVMLTTATFQAPACYLRVPPIKMTSHSSGLFSQ